jgi:predicted Zn-dependent protease
MTQTIDSIFDQGIERYKAGEGPDTLIPVFKEMCDRAPKNSPALTCLAWLYLLADKPIKAHEVAQKAVKLNPQDPQARVNLVLAMLDSAKKGVRPHIDVVQQLILVSEELRTEIEQNIEDGLTRKPEWSSLQRVKAWLFGT